MAACWKYLSNNIRWLKGKEENDTEWGELTILTLGSLYVQKQQLCLYNLIIHGFFQNFPTISTQNQVTI